MQGVISVNKDVLDVIIQVVVVAFPIILAFIIRNYLKGSKYEKDCAAIVQLANSAIDYVENLDKTGQLNLPPDVKKGVFKLQSAAQWLSDQLKDAGINMSPDEAKTWVSSEFQKRMGDPRPVKEIAQQASQAVKLVLAMEKAGAIQLPPTEDRILHDADLAASLVLASLSALWPSLTKDDVLPFTVAELLKNAPSSVQLPSPQDPLTQLANDAIRYVDQLKSKGALTLQPGASGANVEDNLVLARAISNAAERQIPASVEQISEAVALALKQRSVALPA